jgi:hypothetical protein
MRMKREKQAWLLGLEGRRRERERKRQACEFGDIERERWDVREEVRGVKLC